MFMEIMDFDPLNIICSRDLLQSHDQKIYPVFVFWCYHALFLGHLISYDRKKMDVAVQCHFFHSVYLSFPLNIF